MSYNLFIDDERIAENLFPTKTMITVRSCQEGIQYIKENGMPDFISFDHDLGMVGEVEETGYTFAKWVIDYMIDNNIKVPFKYNVHSANPVGAQNINSYIINAFKFMEIK